MHVLQILISSLFFVNKVFVLQSQSFRQFKGIGWFIGAFAAVIGVYYFWMLNLYIMTTLEVGLIILMGYGFIVSSKNKLVEIIINTIIIIVMIALIYFASNGMMSVYEFLGSIFMLLGTYLLTHSQMKGGWFVYCLAHIFCAIVGYDKGQIYFADMQVASLFVSFSGLVQCYFLNKR